VRNLISTPAATNLLWPARATTKISLAAPRHPLADPVGWGSSDGWRNKGVYCLTQLATAASHKESKHVNALQCILYYQYKKENTERHKLG